MAHITGLQDHASAAITSAAMNLFVIPGQPITR